MRPSRTNEKNPAGALSRYAITSCSLSNAPSSRRRSSVTSWSSQTVRAARLPTLAPPGNRRTETRYQRTGASPSSSGTDARSTENTSLQLRPWRAARDKR